MFALYQTPADILYLVLTISIGVVALFLVIVLYNLICLFRNVRHVTSKAKDTIDLVNHYLWQPIKIFMMLYEKGKEYAEKRKSKKE